MELTDLERKRLWGNYPTIRGYTTDPTDLVPRLVSVVYGGWGKAKRRDYTQAILTELVAEGKLRLEWGNG